MIRFIKCKKDKRSPRTSHHNKGQSSTQQISAESVDHCGPVRPCITRKLSGEKTVVVGKRPKIRRDVSAGTGLHDWRR